jgi:hypothetical protein
MSTHNIGEEITGLYLQVERNCEFVQYNLYTPDVQGEIDVVAINFRDQIVYICEVAVHLVTGLQYVRAAQPDTAPRLIKKFNKDIDYAEKAFPSYQRVYMLWSPIVKNSSPTAKHDQIKAVEMVQAKILETRGVQIELMINQQYKDCLTVLRKYASTKTEELKSPVLRIFQLEALLEKHLNRKKRW